MLLRPCPSLPAWPRLALIAAAGLLAHTAAWSQAAPDAGRLLQQDRPAPQAPVAPPALDVAPPASAPLLPGGTTVLVDAVRFSGNSVFGDAQLRAVLALQAGQRFDMAGLQALADRVSDHYRSHGYPFARAYLPAQRLLDGVLEVAVLEGRYGQVSTGGNAALAGPALAFLAPLKPGDVIAAGPLERATLLLSDQPGIEIRPVVRPGQAMGTGDLAVDVQATQPWRGDLALDNHGSSYTGTHRVSAGLVGDSRLRMGDQVTVRAQYSEADQWLGQLGYSLPLGADGWRGQVGHAHTSYQLGKQFAALQASGRADITSAGVSYAWLRSRQTNVSISVVPQYKRLKDDQGATQSHSRKTSQVLPLTVLADHRDGLAGGAVTYGSLGLTLGRLDLDEALRAADDASARSRGGFSKLNLDVVRHQSTALRGLTLYGRVSAQWTGKNLDSSEDFGLGGAAGVRAFPSGEGFGDEGQLVQLEARYAWGDCAPYVFVDHGRVKVNHRPWTADPNHRELGGAGVGMRWQRGAFSADAALAWRTTGGPAVSDGTDKHPRLWVRAGWQL